MKNEDTESTAKTNDQSVNEDIKPFTSFESVKNIENISYITGDWGPLQLKLFIIASLVCLPSSFNLGGILFYISEVNFTCINPPSLNGSIAKCSNDNHETCDKFAYEDTGRRTLVTEFDLVCDRLYLISMALASYQVGYAISGIVIGLLSDKFGRKKALVVSIILEIISAILCSLSTSIYQLIICRLFSGIAGYGQYLSSLILLTENVGPSVRARVLAFYDVSWNMCDVILVLIAYLFVDYKTYFLTLALFEATYLFWIFKTPESIRWQIMNNKFSEAEKELQKYCKDENEKLLLHHKITNLNENLKLQCPNEKKRKGTFWHLFKRWYLLKCTLILYFIWFVVSFTNYGMSFLLRDFAGNIYLNYFYLHFSSLIAHSTLTFYINKYKRRTVFVFLLLTSSASLFLLAPFSTSEKYVYLRSMLIMLGKFFSTQLWTIVYVYTPELFPTFIRHVGIGSCSIVARIGSVFSPFVLLIAVNIGVGSVVAIFAFLAIIGAIAVIFLPETKGKEVPDTIEQMIKNIYS